MADKYYAAGEKVIVGAAFVAMSVIDSASASWSTLALPARVNGTPYADTIRAGDPSVTGWRNVGYTSDGVEVTYSPDFGEIEVDQVLDTVKMYKQKMTATVKTTLVESTLENMLVAWSQSRASLRTYNGPDLETAAGRTVDTSVDYAGLDVPEGEEVLGMEPGELGEDPVERQLIFVGKANRVEQTTTTVGLRGKARERIYHLRRAISVEPSTHGLKRNEGTMFPVSFRLLPSALSGAIYGDIRDRVINR